MATPTGKNIGPPYTPPTREPPRKLQMDEEAESNENPKRWYQLLPRSEFYNLCGKTITELSLIQKPHAILTKRWRASKYCKMVTLLFQREILSQSFVINQAICLGLGSFYCRTAGEKANFTDQGLNSMSQFVVFEYLIELLSMDLIFLLGWCWTDEL